MKNTYERGVPLSDAPLHFAPEHLKREYFDAKKREEQRGEAMRRERAQVLRNASLDAHTRWAIAQQFQIDMGKIANDPNYLCCLPGDTELLTKQTKHSAECGDVMCRVVLADIRNGKHSGIGYEAPRASNCVPVKIPDDVMRSYSKIDFGAGTIEGNGLKFVAVRLVAIARSDIQSGAMPPQTKSSGPKSRGKELIAAYHELRSDRTIQPMDSLKSVCTKIGNLLVERTGNSRGLKYQTMLPFIAEAHRNWRTL